MLNILSVKEIMGEEKIGRILASPKKLIELETICIIVDYNKTTMEEVQQIIDNYDEAQEDNIEWDEPVETEKEYCKHMKLNVIEKTRTIEELRKMYADMYSRR